MPIIKLGTRSSQLATTQSKMVAQWIENSNPGVKVELVEITTTGDEVRDKPLQSFGGAGVFVKELETALIDKRVDIAVHSLKDVPTRQPDGLVIASIAGREEANDVAILAEKKPLKEMPKGSIIGSGSLRRRAQLKAAYPQLEFAEIRGNVDTRIRKIREGQFAGTILARAGLTRMGFVDARGKAEKGGPLENLGVEVIPMDTMLPAPGQGALAIECRSADLDLRKILLAVHDADAEACVNAEREVLERLGGGCHLPLGALGTVNGKRLRLRAALGFPDGTKMARAEETMDVSQAKELGAKVAEIILAQGGREILAQL